MPNEQDIYLFNEGTAERAWCWLGAHACRLDGEDGVRFAVWAPNAKRVSVVGDFNGWDGDRDVMQPVASSGVWEAFVPEARNHDLYKFEVIDAGGNLLPLKADPYARSMQHPPDNASRIMLEEEFRWSDRQWIETRDSGDFVAAAGFHLRGARRFLAAQARTGQSLSQLS